jgi:hypothetical protein
MRIDTACVFFRSSLSCAVFQCLKEISAPQRNTRQLGTATKKVVPTSFWGVGVEVGTALFGQERLERCRWDAACGALGKAIAMIRPRNVTDQLPAKTGPRSPTESGKCRGRERKTESNWQPTQPTNVDSDSRLSVNGRTAICIQEIESVAVRFEQWRDCPMAGGRSRSTHAAFSPVGTALRVWGHLNRISPISDPMADGNAALTDSRSFIT